MAEELKRMPLGDVLCGMSIVIRAHAESRMFIGKPGFGTYKWKLQCMLRLEISTEWVDTSKKAIFITELRSTTAKPAADPEFELRRGPGFHLLAQLCFLASDISSFFAQNKRGGGGDGPLP